MSFSVPLLDTDYDVLQSHASRRHSNAGGLAHVFLSDMRVLIGAF